MDLLCTSLEENSNFKTSPELVTMLRYDEYHPWAKRSPPVFNINATKPTFYPRAKDLCVQVELAHVGCLWHLQYSLCKMTLYLCVTVHWGIKCLRTGFSVIFITMFFLQKRDLNSKSHPEVRSIWSASWQLEEMQGCLVWWSALDSSSLGKKLMCWGFYSKWWHFLLCNQS